MPECFAAVKPGQWSLPLDLHFRAAPLLHFRDQILELLVVGSVVLAGIKPAVPDVHDRHHLLDLVQALEVVAMRVGVHERAQLLLRQQVREHLGQVDPARAFVNVRVHQQGPVVLPIVTEVDVENHGGAWLTNGSK